MKTFFSIALLLSTLCGTAQANGVRKATTGEELQSKLETSLHREDFSGEFSFDELGIETERDAAPFCSRILGLIDALPDFVDCNCAYNFLSLALGFTCDADICTDTFVLPLPVPLPDGICITPTYTGRFFLFNQVLRSKVCNDPLKVSILVNDVEFGLVDMPEVCIEARHKRFKYTQITQCTFNIGDYDCTCAVCEGGQDVTFDCTGATEALGLFAPFAKATCVGVSLLGGRVDKNGILPPFINPLLLLEGVTIKAPN
jgi:hypothetical protein